MHGGRAEFQYVAHRAQKARVCVRLEGVPDRLVDGELVLGGTEWVLRGVEREAVWVQNGRGGRQGTGVVENRHVTRNLVQGMEDLVGLLDVLAVHKDFVLF